MGTGSLSNSRTGYKSLRGARVNLTLKRLTVRAAPERADQIVAELAALDTSETRGDELAKAAGAVGCLTGVLQRA